LLKSDQVKPVTLAALPSLKTNNIQLATLTKMHGRTMQRHIARLKKAGIITKKIWHGSHHCYELWITPEILWITGLTTPKISKMRVLPDDNQVNDNQDVIKNELTKCPHSDTSNVTRNKENIVIAVDTLKKHWQSDKGFVCVDVRLQKKQRSSPQRTAFHSTGYATGNLAGHTPLKDSKKNTLAEEGAQLKESWRAGTQFGEVSPPVCASEIDIPREIRDPDPARHSFLLSYAEKLWKLALSRLYTDKHLTRSQHRIAVVLLYRWYRPVATEKLEFVHKVYTLRIGLVEKYIKKNPEFRFLTLPYLYFDPKNKSGFAGTMSWYRAEKRYRKELRVLRVLREQIRVFKKNEAMDTAQGRPRIRVYLECKRRVEQLGNPEITKQFDAIVLGVAPQNDCTTYNFIKKNEKKAA
jgi:hypothetical protein